MQFFYQLLIQIESKEEYSETLHNLIQCLSPQNQLESLLVEKIAIDFWRLRRVIRFETGSIKKSIQDLLKNYYSYGTQDNEEIDKEIEYKNSCIEWNSCYLKYLEKGLVNFEQPFWEGEDIECEIIEDFYLIAKSIESHKFSYEERGKIQFKGFNFFQIKSILKRNGFS